MRLYRIITLLLIALMFLHTTNPAVAGNHANKSGNTVTIENSSITMQLTGGGNVPKYTFWDHDDNDSKYHVQFSHVFEANDNDDDGKYSHQGDRKVSNSDVALSSLSWDFSEISETNDGVDFNISSVGGDFSITFVNHIGNDASSLKFDVIVDGYTWTDDSAMFVIGFKLIAQGGDNDDDENQDNEEQDGNQVTWGEGGFIDVEATAATADGDIDVGVSTGNDGNSPLVYISYGHFNNGFEHDPTIGVQASASGSFIPLNPVIIPFSLFIVVLIYRKKN